MLSLTVSVAILMISVSIGNTVEGRDNRVIDGQFAKPNQFPFAVAILRKGNADCSGSIIKPSWVLTAAHCINNNEESLEDITLVAGVTDIKSALNIYNVEKLFPNPGFNPQKVNGDVGSEYDIGLIEIKGYFKEIPVQLLPTPPLSSLVTLIGYGSTYPGETVNTRLKYTHLILSHQHLYFKDQLVCSVFDGNGCNGDSGGPVLSEQGQFAVVHGGPNLQCKYTAHITRIDFHLEWIHQIIETHS